MTASPKMPVVRLSTADPMTMRGAAIDREQERLSALFDALWQYAIDTQAMTMETRIHAWIDANHASPLGEKLLAVRERRFALRWETDMRFGPGFSPSCHKTPSRPRKEKA